MIIKRHLFTLCLGILYALIAGHPVLADDIEVLIGPGGPVRMKPNVLFIMDASGNNAGQGANVITKKRRQKSPPQLSIVQDVLKDLMKNPLYQGINISVLYFANNEHGGYFVSSMQKLNDSSLKTNDDTALAKTHYESAYFRDKLSDAPGNNAHQCQKNYTILLTNSEFYNDHQTDIDIRYFLDSDNLNTKTVQTYSISLATDLLQKTTTERGKNYIVVNNVKKLEEAFTSILSVITSANDSFSSPALATNIFNKTSHINRLYYALFEPATTPKWNGNVKPYTLNNAYQLIDAATPARPVVDAHGMFLEASRSFWSDADDGSSIVAGGANGRLPDANDRKLYTYTGDYDNANNSNTHPAPGSFTLGALRNNNSSGLTAEMLGINITDDNGIKDDTKTDAELTHVLNTIRTAPLGAPLHSQPALITYDGTNDADAILTLFVATNDGFLHALDASPGAEGSAEGGKELFAFIPKELLPNLPKLANKTGSVVYGLDGDISVWVKESDDPDSTIEIADNDHVYVYVGMRRGGNNYYALDVTNRTAPALKWVIRGGPGGTPGFEELSQTWSRPSVTSIKYGTETKKVLIFGGGYDTAQDDNPLNADASDENDDTIGRAIFIVDATEGTLLWWAGPTDSDATLELSNMTHSIPSDIRLMDSNHDGHTDRLYVGDMRGQVFRIDLDATLSSSRGTLLASLSGETRTNNRRFYYPPDVVLTRRRDTAPYISINIGSGYRAHPLNHLTPDDDDAARVNDRFYSLRDPYVVGPVPEDETVTIITDGSNGNLFNATNSLITSNTDIRDLAAATGWYITLGASNGEKVLAPSITINGEIIFTTYVPPEQAKASECGALPGTGHLYRVSLFDATPTHNTGEAGYSESPTTPTLDDRYETIRHPGIPSAPTVMFHENNSSGKTGLTFCVNTECEKPLETGQIQKTYWRTR